MARMMSATRGDARATFLLEVALDRARLKQRLAETLLRERVERGGGEARRFPQPRMAELLGYSLRQYQRLEDPNDASLPTWTDLERIADRLDLDASEIFGDPTPDVGAVSQDDELHALREELGEVRGQLAAMQAFLEERLPAAREDQPQAV